MKFGQIRVCWMTNMSIMFLAAGDWKLFPGSFMILLKWRCSKEVTFKFLFERYGMKIFLESRNPSFIKSNINIIQCFLFKAVYLAQNWWNVQVYFSCSIRILYIVSSERLTSLGDDFFVKDFWCMTKSFFTWMKIMFCPEDMYILVALKKELLKNLWRYHKYYHKWQVTLLLISLKFQAV